MFVVGGADHRGSLARRSDIEVRAELAEVEAADEVVFLARRNAADDFDAVDEGVVDADPGLELEFDAGLRVAEEGERVEL